MAMTEDGCHPVVLDHATLLVKVPVHAQEDEARVEESGNFQFNEQPCCLQGVESSLNTEKVYVNGIGRIFT